MPQLDLTIIFSQIFWLTFTFFLSYSLLIHFFLPKFLISIKSRKEITKINTLKVTEIKKNLLNNQSVIQNKLTGQLNFIRQKVSSVWSLVSESELQNNFTLVDKKISLAVFNLSSYYDFKVLNSIQLYSRALSLKN